MGERFLAEGMKVVLSDLRQDALDRVVGGRGRTAPRCTASPPTSRASSRSRPCATPPSTASARCTWCATTPGWRPGARPNLGARDQRLAVRVQRARLRRDQRHHGLRPDPARAGRRGSRGEHRLPQRRLVPMAAAPTYATSKAAVTTTSECLWGQLHEIGSEIGVSVLFPSGETQGILDTGIWAPAERPPEFAPEAPIDTSNKMQMWIDMQEAAGTPVAFTPVRGRRHGGRRTAGQPLLDGRGGPLRGRGPACAPTSSCAAPTRTTRRADADGPTARGTSVTPGRTPPPTAAGWVARCPTCSTSPVASSSATGSTPSRCAAWPTSSAWRSPPSTGTWAGVTRCSTRWSTGSWPRWRSSRSPTTNRRSASRSLAGALRQALLGRPHLVGLAHDATARRRCSCRSSRRWPASSPSSASTAPTPPCCSGGCRSTSSRPCSWSARPCGTRATTPSTSGSGRPNGTTRSSSWPSPRRPTTTPCSSSGWRP